MKNSDPQSVVFTLRVLVMPGNLEMLIIGFYLTSTTSETLGMEPSDHLLTSPAPGDLYTC